MKFPLPDAALAHHIAILGKTGSGKSSTAKLLIEKVAPDFRVCILDPIKSDWWGITSGSDGKRPGFPFTILGGPRGHVPLKATSGAAVGELVGTGALPLSIIDMADLPAGGLQRFFCDFADALMRSARGVVYLVLEEAHEFAPKERAGLGNENMALHFAKKLATAGRSKGIRLVAITQRTQALHNAILSSCETLIAHRITAPADRAPVLGWLKSNADKKTEQSVAGSLAHLPTGTAWVCSGEAKLQERIAFPKFATYDNTATPEGDAESGDVVTAPVDLSALRDLLAASEPGVSISATAQAGEKIDKGVIEAAEQRGYQRGLHDAAAAAQSNWADIFRLMADGVAALSAASALALRASGLSEPVLVAMAEASRIQTGMDSVRGDQWSQEEIVRLAAQGAKPLPLKRSGQPAAPSPSAKAVPPVSPASSPSAAPSKPAEGAGSAGPSSPAEPGVIKRVLEAIAFWEANGDDSPTRQQLAPLANYSPRSSGFDKALSQAKALGLVEFPPGKRVKRTAEGRARRVDRITTQPRAALAPIIGPAGVRVLDAIMMAAGVAISRGDLATATNYSAKTSGFDKILSNLKGLGVITFPDKGMVQAAPWVW